MRGFLIFWTLFCGTHVAAGEPADDDMSGVAKAGACIGCHNKAISLKGRGTDVIFRQIEVIRAGQKGHPTGLGDLAKEDLAAIAAYLNCAD